MLTQCPNCQTTFRVTTEILRVADGQVRCGRCQTQFDALERLIHEHEAASAPPPGPGGGALGPRPAEVRRPGTPDRRERSRERAGDPGATRHTLAVRSS